MGVKITLKGMNISDQASLMNNATITGKDVDIEMEDMVLKDGVSVLDMAHVEQQDYPREDPPAPKNTKKSMGKRFSSFCEGVLVNVVADKLTKK